jgi:hypothetical protein
MFDSLQGFQVVAHLGAGAEQRLLHRRRKCHKVLECRQHVQPGQAAALVPAHDSTCLFGVPSTVGPGLCVGSTTGLQCCAACTGSTTSGQSKHTV